MSIECDQIDAIEACRTCGVYYMSSTNYLKPLFQCAVEYPEMMLIRFELAQWKLEVNENDGLPQYLCHTCIHEFQKIFKFRATCSDTQEQLRAFHNLREMNLANLKIKTEIIDPNEESASQCNFIYVDDLSDGEYDTITPFNIPHVPIKDEVIEEATVPRETGTETIAESASESGVNIRTLLTDLDATSSYSPSSTTIKEIETAVHLSAPTLEHPTLPAVECELCQHLSPNQDEHKQHLRRVHEIRDMECRICGKVFKNSTVSRFKFHLKWHNINKHVKCNQCGFVCSSRQALNEHKRVHAKINCKICGKAVLGKKMKSHLRQHDILNKFPCEYCTEAFQTDQERESHIWQVHANDDSKNITHDSVDEDHPPAASTNINDSTLNADEEVIHVELFCAHCAEKFDDQSDLEKHVIEEHRSGSAQQQQNQSGNEYKEHRTDHNISEALSNTTPGDTFVGGNREAEENAITVFEDYDDSEEELSIPSESLQYPIKQEKILDDTQHFAQYSSNFSEDGDDEVTIEHFNQHQESTNGAAIDKMETSSSSEYESDTDSNTSVSFVQDDVVKLPFACAKCIDKFATVEELLTHNTLMHCQQQQEQNEKSPTKSKFKCDICNKEFDLKFSLNRHMKKHDKTST